MPIAKGERPAEIQIEIEPFDNHSRKAFCCASTPTIQNFCRVNLRRDHDAYKIRAYVAVKPGTVEVLGFYTLALISLVPEEVSERAEEKFARVNAVPAIYLSMIGVSDESAGGGIGKKLMAHAIDMALQISEMAGAFALALDALDEEVAQLYIDVGFERFAEKALKLFLPLSTARASRQQQ